MNNCLATAASFNVVGIFVILCYGAIFALVIITLMRLAKFLGSANREQQLIRLELGKLAEEVHQIRNDLKSKPVEPKQ
jgi:hypothetical protein